MSGAVDTALFRRVMGSFATGVTVISTEARGEVRGMTANAFMSGSLDPPLCVVSVAKRARLHPYLLEAGYFGVSILARDQEKLEFAFFRAPVADLTASMCVSARTPLLVGRAPICCGCHGARTTAAIIPSSSAISCTLQAFSRPPLVVHEGCYASLTYSLERAPEWVADFW